MNQNKMATEFYEIMSDIAKKEFKSLINSNDVKLVKYLRAKIHTVHNSTVDIKLLTNQDKVIPDIPYVSNLTLQANDIVILLQMGDDLIVFNKIL